VSGNLSPEAQCVMRAAEMRRNPMLIHMPHDDTRGLTLRDLFAAFAPDTNAIPLMRPSKEEPWETEAHRRYRYADLMLAERAK
jgi:hypothetical protein